MLLRERTVVVARGVAVATGGQHLDEIVPPFDQRLRLGVTHGHPADEEKKEETTLHRCSLRVPPRRRAVFPAAGKAVMTIATTHRTPGKESVACAHGVTAAL
jgi:hypothetical protein